jgi:hypothetical protein
VPQRREVIDHLAARPHERLPLPGAGASPVADVPGTCDATRCRTIASIRHSLIEEDPPGPQSYAHRPMNG